MSQLKPVCDQEKAVCGFTCTGANYAHVWPMIEKKFEEIMRILDTEIDCGQCFDDGTFHVSGIRDHVKIGIGGEPFDVPKYEKFVQRVNCVYDAWKKRRLVIA